MPPLATDLPSPDSPAAIGWFVVIFFGIMGGLHYTIGVFKQLKDKPATKTQVIEQPLIIRHDERFATRDEHDKLSDRVEGLSEEIRRGFANLDQKRSVSIGGLHEIARAQGESISALKSETTRQTSDLQELKARQNETNNRIDAVPARLIAILRETKGLIQ